MGVPSVAGQDLRALVQAQEARTPRAQPSVPLDAPARTPRPAAQSPTTEEQVKKAAQAVNESPGLLETGVRMRIDKDSSRIVVQIIGEDNKVLKQIPPEELLRIAKRLRELEGLLFDIQT